MEKCKFLYGALGILALGLASCSSDDPVQPGNQTVEKDQTSYLSVAICNPTNFMSRAEGDEDEPTPAPTFENGATAESYVHQLVFVFYDGSGAPTATMYSLDDSKTEFVNGFTENATGNNVTRFWKSVIPVEMTQGQTKPVYVMCYVNPIDQTNLSTASLGEVDAAKRKVVVNENYFAMSNSVYYDANPITGQNNVRVMATPITEGQLYATEEAANAADAKTLDIYVERYAAKIGVTMAPGALTDGYDVVDPAGNKKTLVFTPTHWHPNAMDCETYITKGFATQEGDDVSTAVSYAAMNQAFATSGMNGGDGLDGWNDKTNHRSYWACSPSYYAGIYPQCSDNITDTDAPTYELKYFTYKEVEDGVNTDDVVSNAGVAWDETNGFSTESSSTNGWFYARETTASLEDQTAENINNKAVVGSVVIVGNYKLSTATENEEPITFYLYGKSNGKDVYYDSDASVKAALIANQNVIFTNIGGTNRATNPEIFEVKHPGQAVRNGQNVAGRLVTIQIKNELDEVNPLYFYNGTAFVQVTTDNLDAANRLLWSSASTASMFGNGLAFFSIPVRHLGWGKNLDPTKPLVTKNTNGTETINWQNLRRGDLGIVRNHVYQLEVSKVVGLGIGLRDENQPMVPPMDPDNYYISAKLNILAWRIVPAQSGIVL